MTNARLDHLWDFLARLDEHEAHYSICRRRSDCVLSVDVTVPGSFWEIDYLEDGTVDVEVFRSDGTIHSESKLGELLQLIR